ncbi:glycoside hydrolase family 20 protein [Rutstroemia sp. NJR-2017a BBW]|nr:glycoside hydrolase family 20 protein [Rutstroemia sp. NJR-2017a BBW]
MRSSTFLVSSLISSALALWPQPVSYTHGSDALWLTEDVKITYNGGSVWWHSLIFFDDEYTKTVLDQQIMGYYGGRSASAATSKSIVTDAIKRAKQNLFKESLIPWKLVPRNELSSFEPSLNATKKYITSLAITQTGTENSTSFKPQDGQVDESYNLTITTDGQAFITSPSAYGVLHGLSSFVQLFYKHSAKGAGIYTNLAPVQICDAPKFAHRGLNMDVARNWYPVESIERTIDALAFNKFNRLHLHVTDAQSWPLEIPAIPELADKGAYSSGLSYSPSDVRSIQEYAQARGVEVIIEIDMPGHTTSIGLAFPELMTAYNAAPWDTYCAEPPCGSLQLNNPKVGDFLDKLFADLLPRVSPYSSYFHTGGDELNVNAYSLDPTVKSNDTAVIQPLLQKFVDRNHDQIRAAGLTPVVWEEMYTTWNLTLGSDVIVQTWLSDASVAQVVNAGHKAIAGNYNFWYLDCGKGQWLDFTPGASFQKYYPFPDYCSPMKNWRLVYSYDPLAGVPENSTHLVVGGEVHIWSEQTDPVNIDDMVWPRASAAGEVLWSGAKDASGQNRSQLEASPRLAEMRERLVLKGINSGPVQMVFCTQSNSTATQYIQRELKIRSLGGHARKVKTYLPLDIDFIANSIKLAGQNKNLEAWRGFFTHGKGYTVEASPGGLRCIFTAEPENIKAILATQFTDYGKGKPFHEDWKDFLGDSIFTTDLDQWHDSRQLIRPQFIKDRVSDLDVFERHVQILIRKIKEEGKKWDGSQGGEIDVSDLFFRYTLDAATDFLLGRSVDSLEIPAGEFADAFGEVQRVQSIIARAGFVTLSFIAPLNRLVPRKSFYQGLDVINQFVNPFIDEALQLSPDELATKTKTEEGYTFLHALASYTRDRKMLRDQLVAVLLAGRDTTAATLSWTFYELARHPEAFHKLREEIIAKVGLEDAPTYQHLKDMKYLQNTMHETLRLYPAVPFNVRLALKDTTLPTGGGPDGLSPIGILKDTPIGYSTIVMQRRADLTPDVDSFNPDRWTTWQPKPWQYVPFNGGPRICIGQQFALTEMAYTIVRVLQAFEGLEGFMHAVDGGNPSLKADIVLQPGQGVRVGFLERREVGSEKMGI